MAESHSTKAGSGPSSGNTTNGSTDLRPSEPVRLSAVDGQPAAASTTAPKPGEYGADQIQVLEGLEAVRKRPGMYIGGTGVGPLHHLIYEVVDNSIDEAMAGFASTVVVTVQADGSCSVLDNGRGIPVEPKKDPNPAYDGKPAVEIAMTVLHAGGKFGQEGSAYKVSGGLHGVGVSCVNALSEWLEADIYRAGKIHRIAFSRGKTTEPLRVVGNVDAQGGFKTGTKVTFMPDPEIFPDTRFDYATLANRLRELSYLNPGVTIRLVDERAGPDGKPRAESFKASDGLREYTEHLMHGKQPVSTVVSVKKDDPANNLSCEVALQYHDGYNETVLAFANNINNVDGGTHAQGFKVALTRALNGYAKRSGILKEKDPTPTGEDLREGLVAIVSVKLPNPTFNNQPKEKLLNPEIEKFVADAVAEQLDTWLEEHPGEGKRLCLKGINAAQAREAARKARELTRRKSALDSGSMPHKLLDCRTKDIDRSELFIVEGDSAMGSARGGRDAETQAVLPIKGKILNVEKARLDKVLSFEEIRTLISALRCGIGEDFDASKLRYGRVIMMTDADVDGSHIRTLLLTFFFRQMPELVRRGKVYIAQPPLYKLTWGKGKSARSRYVVNQDQMDQVLAEQGLDRARLIVRDLSTLTSEDRARGMGEAPVVRTLEGEDARRAVRLLSRLAELVKITERRGIRFADLLAARAGDPTAQQRLPSHRLQWAGSGAGTEGHDAWAWSEDQARELARAKKLVVDEPTSDQATAAAGTPASNAAAASPTSPGAAPTPGARAAVLRELHENREMEKVFAQLERLGLPIASSTLSAERAVTGEWLPTMYAWQLNDANSAAGSASDAATRGDDPDGPGDAPADDEAEETAVRPGPGARGNTVEAANLFEILSKLHEVGRKGLEIKRFKGLGEMNAEELAETTMDPTKRTMLRVNWDVASEAELLFSVLMGEDVEQRRKFIEDHALEVRNLDV